MGETKQEEDGHTTETLTFETTDEDGLELPRRWASSEASSASLALVMVVGTFMGLLLVVVVSLNIELLCVVVSVC